MAAQYMPKTLAKTITYIIYHSPGEYGLFWNQDGTMPWKELYWAFQEDPSLRFFRESNFREFSYLGIDIPAILEGNLIRLRQGFPTPDYPIAEKPPERLFYACRKKRYAYIREHGISPSGRPYIPVASDRELAVRMGMRRDPNPMIVEILAGKAASEGMEFRKAGPDLYLVDSVPLAYLLLPPIREEELARQALKKKKEKHAKQPTAPQTPGSFFVEASYFHEHNEAGGIGKVKKKDGRGATWKKEARKERHKRSI